jgi:hypothetical protein
MPGSAPMLRRLVAGAVTVGVVVITATFTGVGLAGSPLTQSFRGVDTGLCRFPLRITVIRNEQIRHLGSKTVQLIGPSTITLRNASTGRTAMLESSIPYVVDPATGSVTFRGHQIWLGVQSHVPYLSTDGAGHEDAPHFVLTSARAGARVIDPCALVAATTPSTTPVATPAPWGLAASALSQIDYAGLIPVLGNLIRHDHVHLDVIVNRHKVVIPGDVGLAEPVDKGPCPHGSGPNGDCATGHFFTAKAALSPIHTHSTSGIIHIESDRPGTFTLGEFFDEWGVRFSSKCLGAYCAGGGKVLRVFVNGHRVSGDPRGIVLTNRKEIAVVFGATGGFGSVPSTYAGAWPGLGCGGTGEHSCFP